MKSFAESRNAKQNGQEKKTRQKSPERNRAIMQNMVIVSKKMQSPQDSAARDP